MADKKVEQDIAVDQDKKKFVSDATRKILQLFNVQVTLSAPESAGIQWVQLKGRKEDIENAKNYINSLCSPEISDVKVSIPERYFEAILNYRDHVEKNSGAVVLFPSRTVASVQGSEMAVVIATSAIEERVNELKAGANGFPALLNSGSNSAQQKTEKEMAQNTPVPYIDPSLEEFAIKLGYTKDDIHQVLKKLGKEVDQNTLLRELIKVSSPSLLQRARPEYPPPKPVAYYDKVVARGASSRVAPKSYPYEDATSKKEDTVARGVTCRPPPRSFSQEPTSQSNRVVPNSFPFEGATTTRKEDIVARGACPRSEPVNTMQGVLSQHERQQYVYDRPEDDAFMYQQVVGNSSASIDTSSDLRHIVIDGSNVAMSHGNQQFFSCMGIKICVDYFKKRGHKDITVFVPQWRKETPRPDAPMKNREILAELEAERHLVYTPSRRVNGRRIVCYDDRFVLKLANDTDGVVVSNDHFRDLFNESPRWQDVIEQRILMYSFVNDIFMVPEDPLGRHGPTLDDFLRKGTPTHRRVCPYLKRCTYGLRCRFYHPERDPARKETVKPSNQRDVRSGAIQGVEQYQYHPGPPVLQQHTLIGQIRERAYDYPLQSANTEGYDPTEGARASTFQHLESVFPDQREIILQVMRENPNADVEHLGELITYHI